MSARIRLAHVVRCWGRVGRRFGEPQLRHGARRPLRSAAYVGGRSASPSCSHAASGLGTHRSPRCRGTHATRLFGAARPSLPAATPRCKSPSAGARPAHDRHVPFEIGSPKQPTLSKCVGSRNKAGREPRNGQQDGRRNEDGRAGVFAAGQHRPTRSVRSRDAPSGGKAAPEGNLARQAGWSPSVMFVGFVDGELVIACSCPLPSPSSRTRARARERRERTVPTGRAPARRPYERPAQAQRASTLARAGAVSRSCAGWRACAVRRRGGRRPRLRSRAHAGSEDARARRGAGVQTGAGFCRTLTATPMSGKRTTVLAISACVVATLQKTIDDLQQQPSPLYAGSAVDSACVPFEQCAEGERSLLRSQAPGVSVRQWPHAR